MIHKKIEEAAASIAKVWPLYAFVTANPLSGYEKIPFEKAVAEAKKLFGAKGYPSVSFFRQAWAKGEIDIDILTGLLKEQFMFKAPDYYLEEMEAWDSLEKPHPNPYDELDRMMIKWLSVFLDEGMSEWSMPERAHGFYKAWRALAPYDQEIKNGGGLNNLPEDSTRAIAKVVEGYPSDSYLDIFKYHLAALPGWAGYIKYRSEHNTQWQQEYPVSLSDYLGVRLTLARHMGHPVLPSYGNGGEDYSLMLHKIWLEAWEKTFQKQLVKGLKGSIGNNQKPLDKKLSGKGVQMVFCIDTRSELIRRHIEHQGNYETFGYAGFFGIPMDYQSYRSEKNRKSCPPILESAYEVKENPRDNEQKKTKAYDRFFNLHRGFNKMGQLLKRNIPASFGFVEGAGSFYGFSMFMRTFFSRMLYKAAKYAYPIASFCDPEVWPAKQTSDLHREISIKEKAILVKTAFDLMGWKHFAPLVVFIAHGSHTSNNPFGSSLDCGACAGSPGHPNARTLAFLANQPPVRKALIEDFGIYIPEETYFLAGEHNTTTEEVVLFDELVPSTHKALLQKLTNDLKNAKISATAERTGGKPNSVKLLEKKANNWADTRPEWGLATNAGFVIAPRSITAPLNLDRRCFLHSYNWELDQDGTSLEAIMQGPMIVTQWINNHYYFSTVDNDVFGSGSKITHNITGKFGVVQGNGGDLKPGLPLQSLKLEDDKMYHQPLRLTVMIHAPLRRVENILMKHEESLLPLVANQWIYLGVLDPEQNNEVFFYEKGKWAAPAFEEQHADSQWEVPENNMNGIVL